MEESDVFVKLVRELDPVERKELLGKLTTSETVKVEVLIEPEADPVWNPDTEYQSLNLLSRLIITLKSVFTSDDKYHLIEDLIFKKIEKDVRQTGGDLLSFKNGRLLPAFCNELENLHKAATFFAAPIRSCRKSGMDEFLNYLGSFHIPSIHRELELAADFNRTGEIMGSANPSEVRREILMNVETVLAKITGDRRKEMYVQAKTLHVLTEFVNYDFKKMKDSLSGGTEEDPGCYFGDARPALEALTNILAAFTLSPDQKLMEALFLCSNNDLKVDEHIFLQSELSDFIREAKKHIKGIKNFNRNVQPLKLMKLVTGNVGYKPKPAAGGEDWFNIYSTYWYGIVERRYRKYSTEKRKEKLHADIKKHFGKNEMPSMKNYRGRFKNSCGFALEFIRDELAAGLNEVLKKILVDGKFYKKQNRTDFTESYSGLLSLHKKIIILDNKCVPDGDYSGDSSESPDLDGQTIDYELADFDAKQIMKKALDSIFLLKNVIYGILHGKAGGQFDSLSNLNKMVTVESRDFIIDLNEALFKVENAFNILGDLVALEESD